MRAPRPGGNVGAGTRPRTDPPGRRVRPPALRPAWHRPASPPQNSASALPRRAHRRPPPARAATARPPSSHDPHRCARCPARAMPNPGCRRYRPHGTRSTLSRPSTWRPSPGSTQTPRPVPRSSRAWACSRRPNNNSIFAHAEVSLTRVDTSSCGCQRGRRQQDRPAVFQAAGRGVNVGQRREQLQALARRRRVRHDSNGRLEPHGRARGSPLRNLQSGLSQQSRGRGVPLAAPNARRDGPG